MRNLLSITLVFTACNQTIYDQVYRAIIERALASDLKHSDIETKNDTIENLRALCRGQRSTFETGGVR